LIAAADSMAEVGWDVFVQYGHSRPPRVAVGAAFMSRGELDELMRGADRVVTHGGPATVLQALENGKAPFVCPRSPELGEHVDDHQQLFARHLDRHGMAVIVEHPEGLVDLLAGPEAARVDLTTRGRRVAENRERLARDLDAWLASLR